MPNYCSLTGHSQPQSFHSPQQHQTNTMPPQPITLLLTFSLLTIPTLSTSSTNIRLPSTRKLGPQDSSSQYCQSWRFSVEVNDAGTWATTPSQCRDFIETYMNGESYSADSDLVAQNALDFAKSVANVSAADAWVFDVDETLLSSLPYYALHGYGSEVFNEDSFYEWSSSSDAPALPASLKLYKELQQLGFSVFILTGRDEHTRSWTERNLLNAGYSNWKRLLLRGPNDVGTTAIEYKSGRRKGLEDEGYRIRGNSGDQWSDLLGPYGIAQRSFKLPNIMYYIP